VNLAADLDIQEAAAKTWEVAVVGAGPAGAFAAQQLAQSGVEVLLIDKQRFPRYKVCGCCINAHAVEILTNAGLFDILREHGAIDLESCEVYCKGQRGRVALPGGLALSREIFDAALVHEAKPAGARFLPETKAALGPAARGHRVLKLSQRQTELEIHARVVIGADGLTGTLRNAFAELASQPAQSSFFGVGSVASLPSPQFRPGVIYMGCSKGGYAGMVQIENDKIAIAAALAYASEKNPRTLAAGIARVLEEAELPFRPALETLEWRGTPALTRRPKRISTERFFAIGDAAGYIEPFTGEGIVWALRSALTAIPFVQRGVRNWTSTLEQEWEQRYDAVIRRRQIACKALTAMLRRPILFEGAVRLLQKHWLPVQPIINYLHRAPQPKS